MPVPLQCKRSRRSLGRATSVGGASPRRHLHQRLSSTVPGNSTLAAFVLPERMALIGDTLPELSRTKGPIRSVWQSYSDILVFEVQDAMSDTAQSDPYANTGMGLLTYSVSE